ncbi:hypothetical protein K432DRAFT_279566, partial [Lepidopterella palustris CBS 459.81]
YRKQEAALLGILVEIQATISQSYYTYTIPCDTAYDMLVALKMRAAPSSRARELELQSRYAKLKKTPRSQAIEPWLQLWENTYTDFVRLRLPEVDRDRLIHDFLFAIRGV